MRWVVLNLQFHRSIRGGMDINVVEKADAE
jgi:hypothetical protein